MGRGIVMLLSVLGGCLVGFGASGRYSDASDEVMIMGAVSLGFAIIMALAYRIASKWSSSDIPEG